ncbi:MAG: enoyl-CoA hydratase [Desulfatibacillaceae bacterium]
MEKTVLYEKRNNTALLTLNRPERKNAISQDLLVNLYDGLERARADESVVAAVLTGAGTTFCSGLDLARLATDNLMDPRGDGRDLLDILDGFDKPLIGAVNGHAITGGFELALNCDFLLASENASFADTHVKVGIHPGWGMTQLLKEAVGVRMARQMSFTGQFIDAQTALRCGLVNEVVPADILVDRALEVADAIAAVNRDMLGTVKNLIDRGARMPLGEGMRMEREGFKEFLRAAGALKTS